MTGLAYIGKIIEIHPIPEADKIESATIIAGQGGRWTGIIRKGDFQKNSLCEVFLPDSILPAEERFSFLKSRKYLIRLCRLRGAPSEVLIMPKEHDGDVGTDITAIIGVTKYTKKIPASLSGDVFGSFPGFVPKTDEPNFQTVSHLVAELSGKPFYATVKADGTSTTAYYRDDHFGVCSRNWEYKEVDTKGRVSLHWKLAREYGLEENLRAAKHNLALQWETVGPGIQKNPLGLEKPEMRLFDVYDITAQEYLSPSQLIDLSEEFAIPMVSVVSHGELFNYKTAEELRKFAEGTYQNGHQREGIVIRGCDVKRVLGERVSFKIINLLYKG